MGQKNNFIRRRNLDFKAIRQKLNNDHILDERGTYNKLAIKHNWIFHTILEFRKKYYGRIKVLFETTLTIKPSIKSNKR